MKKLTEKNLMKKAERLAEKLKDLQEEARALVDDFETYRDEVDYDNYIYSLKEIKDELEEFGYSTEIFSF